MTGRQLTLGDCDPMWHDWDQICAETPATPAQRPHRDLRSQRLKRRRKYRIADVQVVGEYL